MNQYDEEETVSNWPFFWFCTAVFIWAIYVY